MAGDLQSANFGSGRRKKRRSPRLMSEINVTPFVDVILVLLIVFMVTAPLLVVGVPIELPETEAKPLEGDTEPITVSVNRDGKVFIQNTEIDPDQLEDKLVAISKNGYNERIFVRGDTDVDYGVVMKVMARIDSAGFKRIGLVTLEEQGN